MGKGYYLDYGTDKCKVCGKEFKKKAYNSSFCSDECRKKSNSQRCIAYAKRRSKVDAEFRKYRSVKTMEYRRKKREANAETV